MKYIFISALGVLFGFALFAGEVVSWERINAMFNFAEFHMYGVIGSAIVTGLILRLVAKAIGLKTVDAEPLPDFKKSGGWKSLLFGGIIFGIGWACTGACPGPMFIQIGAGNGIFALILIAALLGTLFYGSIKGKLPH